MNGLKKELLPRYTSIVIVSHISDEMRSKMFRLSLASLIETTKHQPVEIIVVDNGGDETISKTLISMADQNMIHCYIKNSNNLDI